MTTPRPIMPKTPVATAEAEAKAEAKAEEGAAPPTAAEDAVTDPDPDPEVGATVGPGTSLMTPTTTQWTIIHPQHPHTEEDSMQATHTEAEAAQGALQVDQTPGTFPSPLKSNALLNP
jgi:hypothetical protein